MATTELARDMEALFDRLFPICRSLTGNGVRQTLAILREYMPLEIHEIPSGTPVFDWTIPNEWNIRDAYILDPAGRKIVDFQKCNLHVVGYSVPVDTKLSLEELRPHLYSLPNQPDAIPYLTSYYEALWGFCMTQRMLESLTPGDYTVRIDSTLAPGSLTYGDLVMPAETNQEILLSTIICHPSLGNHETTGPVALAFLYRRLAARQRRFTYRFVLIPETIGSIAYLARHGEHLRRNLVAGYTLLGLGMPDYVSYKRSRRGDTLADRVAEHVLRHRGVAHKLVDFHPLEGDERQYCSPGFNLPVGSFRRREPGQYPQYHTSLDDKGMVSFDALGESVDIIDEILQSIEADQYYISSNPYCEPMLGKRGLYRSLGSQKTTEEETRRMFFVLNYADGRHSLREVADKAGIRVLDLLPTVERLCEAGLVRKAQEGEAL